MTTEQTKEERIAALNSKMSVAFQTAFLRIAEENEKEARALGMTTGDLAAFIGSSAASFLYEQVINRKGHTLPMSAEEHESLTEHLLTLNKAWAGRVVAIDTFDTTNIPVDPKDDPTNVTQ